MVKRIVNLVLHIALNRADVLLVLVFSVPVVVYFIGRMLFQHLIQFMKSSPVLYGLIPLKPLSFLTYNITNAVSKHKMTLVPGILKSWRNFQITLIGVTSPPSPILSSKFLTDGTRTILIQASASGQPISGTIGELQCANRDKASTFDCYIPHDSCSCQPQETRISCQCAERNLEPLFLNKEFVLPLQTQGITISGTGNNLNAEYNGVADLEVQISVQNLHLVTVIEKTTCKISPLAFQGCYSCLTGSKLEYMCTTDSGNALAHISCGEGSFSAKCSARGTKGVATMTFSHAQVQETCVVSCPAGSTTFFLNSTLVFINKPRLGKISNVFAKSSGESKASNVDYGFLGSWLKTHWVTTIVIVLVVIILVIISIPLAPIIFSFMFKNLMVAQNYIWYKIRSRFKSSPKRYKFTFRKSQKKKA